MKLKKIQLDQFYAYEHNKEIKRGQAVGLRNDLFISPKNNTPQARPYICMQTDDELVWVEPGKIRRTWDAHEQFKSDALERARLFEELAKTTHGPVQGERDYWGQGGNVLIGAAELENYQGPDILCQNPSEAWFLKKLDAAGLHFLYEPRLFVCEKGGFRPDFYLPQTEMYVEICARRRRSAGEKRRKSANVHRLYPGTKIVILYWEDLLALHEQDLDQALLLNYFAMRHGL